MFGLDHIAATRRHFVHSSSQDLQATAQPVVVCRGAQ
jgi:hypothetical protein